MPNTNTAAKSIPASAIPVIDCAALDSRAAEIGRQMRAAAETVGFFYVKNHGLPAAVIANADAAGRAFFRRPLAEKRRLAINASHHGFLGPGLSTMDDATAADLKESFVWGLDLPDGHPALTADNPFLGRNRWPDDPVSAELRPALTAFFTAGLRCAERLMRAFAASLGLPENAFITSCSRPIARASVVYYPPQTEEHGQRFGVSPHTDFGVLTLLAQDQIGGLEVQDRNGDWVTARPLADTLVVNVGDLLARWSNDVFRSTPHRVINRSGRERCSLVLAWDPDFDTVIDPALTSTSAPARYPPVRCGDYILRRFDRAFAYRKPAA